MVLPEWFLALIDNMALVSTYCGQVHFFTKKDEFCKLKIEIRFLCFGLPLVDFLRGHTTFFSNEGSLPLSHPEKYELLVIRTYFFVGSSFASF